MVVKVREARDIRTERRANAPLDAPESRVVSGALNNFSASAAPTVNDDGVHGYDVGSSWVDVVLKDGYLCVDATSGAAVWKKVTP